MHASVQHLLYAAFWVSLATASVHAQNSFTNLWGGPLMQDGVGVLPINGQYVVAVREFRGAELRHGARLATFSQGGQPLTQTPLDLGEGVFLQATTSTPTGAYLAGSRIDTGTNLHAPLLVRLGSDQNVLWTASPNLPSSTQLLGVATLPDGGAAVCGTQVTASGKDAFIGRFNSEGTLLWQIASGLALDDEANGIAVDATHIMITGRQQNFGGGSDALFMRVSLGGQIAWTTSWGGVGSEVGHALVATSDGNFVMSGSSSSYGPANAQGVRRDNLHLLKIDVNGDTLWTRTFGDLTHDTPGLCVTLAANNDILVGGTRARAGAADSYAARISPIGALLWQRTWDTGKEEKLLHLHALADGFLASGWSFGPNGRQVLLLRRNADGE